MHPLTTYHVQLQLQQGDHQRQCHSASLMLMQSTTILEYASICDLPALQDVHIAHLVNPPALFRCGLSVNLLLHIWIIQAHSNCVCRPACLQISRAADCTNNKVIPIYHFHVALQLGHVQCHGLKSAPDYAVPTQSTKSPDGAPFAKRAFGSLLSMSLSQAALMLDESHSTSVFLSSGSFDGFTAREDVCIPDLFASQ